VSSTEALACPQAQPRQQKALNGGGGQRSGGLGAQRRDGAAHVKVEARMLFGEVELLLRVLVLRDAAG